jgi:DNA-binding CsgD family transcriptional regulator
MSGRLRTGFGWKPGMQEEIGGLRRGEEAGLMMSSGYVGFSCALLSISLFLVKGVGITVFRLPISAYAVTLVMLMLLVSSWCSDFLRTERGLLCLRVCAAAGSFGPLLLFVSDFNPVFIFPAALSVASFTLLWGRFLSLQDHQTLLLITAIACMATGIFLMFMLDFEPVFIVLLITVSALLSSFCDFLAGREITVVGHEASIALSRSRSAPGRGNRFTIVTLGLVLGVVMVMAASIDYEQRITALVFGGTIVFASLVTLLLRVRFRTVYEDVARRTLAVFTTLALLPYPFLVVEGKIACTCVLLFSITVNMIILIDAIAETSRLRMISPYWITGREGALFLFGVLIGLSGFWYYFTGVSSENFVVAACVLLIIVFALMQIFIENQTYPFFDDESPGGIETGGPAFSQAVSFSTKGGSTWKRKLDVVADEKGLSPRQKEVMKLLVKGRDVKYIMDHFVISRATAKTHVYNLYRKLGIHSRQELLNLIEDTPPEGV